MQVTSLSQELRAIGKDGEVGGPAVCHICPIETFLIIIQIAPFPAKESGLPMYDNAVFGCGTCYFDCRFCISRLPGNFKVIAQILGCFASGCEGQNAFISRPCSC